MYVCPGQCLFLFVIAHHACPRSSPFIEFFNGLPPEFPLVGQAFDKPHYKVVVLDCAVNAPVHKLVFGISQGVLFNPIPDFKFFNIGMVGKNPAPYTSSLWLHCLHRNITIGRSPITKLTIAITSPRPDRAVDLQSNSCRNSLQQRPPHPTFRLPAQG